MMKVTTEKWAHGSAKHNAWLAYVDAAMKYGNAKRFSKHGLECLIKDAVEYIESLNWSKCDE